MTSPSRRHRKGSLCFACQWGISTSADGKERLRTARLEEIGNPSPHSNVSNISSAYFDVYFVSFNSPFNDPRSNARHKARGSICFNSSFKIIQEDVVVLVFVCAREWGRVSTFFSLTWPPRCGWRDCTHGVLLACTSDPLEVMPVTRRGTVLILKCSMLHKNAVCWIRIGSVELKWGLLNRTEICWIDKGLSIPHRSIPILQSWVQHSDRWIGWNTVIGQLWLTS